MRAYELIHYWMWVLNMRVWRRTNSIYVLYWFKKLHSSVISGWDGNKCHCNGINVICVYFLNINTVWWKWCDWVLRFWCMKLVLFLILSITVSNRFKSQWMQNCVDWYSGGLWSRSLSFDPGGHVGCVRVSRFYHFIPKWTQTSRVTIKRHLFGQDGSV